MERCERARTHEHPKEERVCGECEREKERAARDAEGEKLDMGSAERARAEGVVKSPRNPDRSWIVIGLVR